MKKINNFYKLGFFEAFEFSIESQSADFFVVEFCNGGREIYVEEGRFEEESPRS